MGRRVDVQNPPTDPMSSALVCAMNVISVLALTEYSVASHEKVDVL